MEFRIPVVNQWNWLIVGINGLLTASMAAHGRLYILKTASAPYS